MLQNRGSALQNRPSALQSGPDLQHLRYICYIRGVQNPEVLQGRYKIGVKRYNSAPRRYSGVTSRNNPALDAKAPGAIAPPRNIS